jgi:hypothetical protein
MNVGTENQVMQFHFWEHKNRIFGTMPCCLLKLT